MRTDCGIAQDNQLPSGCDRCVILNVYGATVNNHEELQATTMIAIRAIRKEMPILGSQSEG